MTRFTFDKEKKEKRLLFLQALNPAINPKAVHLMDEMHQVSHALYQIRENSVNKAGISYAKYRILMNLMYCQEVEGRDDLNPSEISRRQGTSRNTISALIRDLEEEGLIERHLDEDDRRKFNIQLTENGRARVHDHMRRHFQVIAGCFNALSDDEKDTLSRLLNKIHDSLKSVDERHRQETGV